jgi:peptide/nickel transport system permease protein
MSRFIVRRLAFLLLTLLLASILIFAITQILPGDVATSMLGQFATQQAKENLRHELGLDQSRIVQYGRWLSGFVRGDWGSSISMDAQVRPVVLQRLQNSGRLAIVGFLLYVPIGILLGLIAALRRNSAVDHVISVGSLVFIGLPEFVTGLILIWLVALKLQWLPASSSIAPDAGFFQSFPQLILPAITISLTTLAYIVRMTRSSTVEELRKDYVRTAYLKGLRPRVVIFKQVLRNSLLPTVTVAAMSIGWLIGGLIVTESVFSYPGLGRLVLFAIQNRDLPLIQATSMLLVVIFMLSNLLADILYAYLSPRIRYS